MKSFTARAAKWKTGSRNSNWIYARIERATHWLKANQLRMWLSGVAYVLLNEVRRVGLAGTKLARAYVGTIRAELCKLGAVVKVSVRRIAIALSSAYPKAELFSQVLERLRAAPS